MLTKEEQILAQIEEAKNILITFPDQNDLDGLASALALNLILKKLERKSAIISRPISEQNKIKFNFLPGLDKINNNFNQDKLKTFDLIIVLNSLDLETLGKIYTENTDFFYHTTIINLSHKSKNDRFGQINLIDLNRTSAAEILFAFFYRYFPDFLDEPIATCLLAGIIFKTNNFRNLNITPKTLGAAARLISLGAKREEIVKNLFISRDIILINAWGEILSNLTGELNNKIIHFYWDKEKISQILKPKNIELKIFLTELIQELIIKIPETELIIAFYEIKKQNKISTNTLVYSAKNIHAAELLGDFNPQGDQKIALFGLEENLESARRKILISLKNKLLKLDL